MTSPPLPGFALPNLIDRAKGHDTERPGISSTPRFDFHPAR
jgi:hypothetical protein